MLASRPGLRESVQANRAFLGWVVRLLATEYGIRQFFDIGTGIPSANNTHQVARAAAPDAKTLDFSQPVDTELKSGHAGVARKP